MRRAGNGRRIHALKDKWILREGNFKPILGLKDDPGLTMDYFIGINHEWCRERLEKWFVPSNVLTILAISLGIEKRKDNIYWSFLSEWLLLSSK